MSSMGLTIDLALMTSMGLTRIYKDLSTFRRINQLGMHHKGAATDPSHRGMFEIFDKELHGKSIYKTN